MHGRKRAGGVGLRVMELVMSRIGRMLAMVVAALALTAAPAIAAVPQEAYTRVAFAEGCSGHGYWFSWDAVLYPDPTLAPGWDNRRYHEVSWSPDEPVTIPHGGPDTLEAGRYGFLLLDSSGETVLFRALYGVQLEPRRFVLDVTLDCSTIPYTIVSLGDTAMVPTPSAPGGPPLVVLTGIGCLIGSLILALRRWRGARPNRRAG